VHRNASRCQEFIMTSDSLSPPADQQPTRIRVWIVGWTMLLAVLLYLDRFCISIAELYIQQDLGLTDVQIGWMLSAFFWTYALAQVPSGWLTDRYGARIMMALYVLAWSTFTGLTGLATGFIMLILLRFGFGVAQAGAYPTSAVILSHWAPITGRGMASSIVSLGGRVGGAIAPILTALLIVMFVPLSHNSRFTPRDLLHPSQLAERFAVDLAQENPHSDTPTDSPRHLSIWVWEQLSPATRRELAFLARTRISDAWITGPTADQRGESADQNGEPRDPEEARAGRRGSLPGEAVQPLDRQRLTDDLNALLDDPRLGELDSIDRSRLPQEGRRLLAKSSAERTPAQRERLHRLVLESLERQAIRQLYVDGWRPVMLSYGLLGIPLTLGFWFLFRNHPSQHPRCNAAERAWILRGKPSVDQPARPTFQPIPIRALVTNRSMWLNSISQCGTNVGWVFLVTWLPRYLDNRHGIPVDQRAVMTFLPVAVGFAGLLLGGGLTDRLTRIIGPRWGRALPIGGSRLLATVAYLACLFDPSPWVAVALFSVVAFATDLGIGGTWAFVQDVGGRHVGSVLGWGNMWGNLGAAAATPLLIWIVGASQNWEAAFLTCAAAFLIAGVAGLGIDATKPLVQES
jgi:MFS transporter, ACS family, glucarate transporter